MIEQTGVAGAAAPTTRPAPPAKPEREQPVTPQADGEAPVDEAHTAPSSPPAANPSWLARHARDVAGMALLLAALAFLWGRGRYVWYWIDEGISLGIASQPLSRLPELLSQDGAPPLYYVLLHFWIGAVGTSEAATHVLSLLFALATVPVALWSGWSLFGRRAGWVCAALAALNPYLAIYANETRMYTLVVLVSVLAVATFLHAFVFAHRRYLPAFVLVLALALYTHNWGLFLGLALGVAMLVVAALSSNRRRVLLDGVLAFGAVALAYAPWVPTLLYQMEHSGAPWLRRPTLEVVRSDVVSIIGEPHAVAVLAIGLAFGLAVLVPWPWPRLAPPVATAVVVSALVVAVTVGVAWLVSRQESVWTYRYLGVVVGPLLLVLGAGLAKGGRMAAAGLAVYAAFMVPVGVKGPPDAKSNVKDIAEQAAPALQPGDLVIASLGRAPVLHHYLPAELVYAETTGAVAGAGGSDQRDPIERLQRLVPEETLPPLLDAIPGGGHALVVCPPLAILLDDDTEFVIEISERCDDALNLVRDDPRFRLDLEVIHGNVSDSPENGYLFTKTEE